MMKHLFALAATKIVDATHYAAAKTPDSLDDDGDREAAVDAPDNDAPEADAAELLYADDDEFESAFGDEWPNLPGENLKWLVAEEESPALLIAYDRDSASDDEYLQTPSLWSSDGASHPVRE